MVFGRHERKPSAIQTLVQAWSGDRSRETERSNRAGNKKTAFSNKQAGSDIMRYAIVIEKAANNFSAYVPDLPGCIATGVSVEEVEVEIKEAIVFHLEGMREDGIAPPIPQSQVEYVEVAA